MSKALVAWFSAEYGSTAKVAEKLAAATGADKFEIVPVKPYTKADMNYSNPVARCNREKIGRRDVPIAGTVNNMADYDTVYIGFPIWYYGAPNIIQTFVKQYDLAGKKVALFVTSGGSDVGRTVEKLQPYLSAGTVIAACKRFDAAASESELAAWAKSI